MKSIYKFVSDFESGKERLKLLNEIKDGIKIVKSDLKEINNKHITNGKLIRDLQEIEDMEQNIEIIESSIRKIELLIIHHKKDKIAKQKQMDEFQVIMNELCEEQDVLTDRMLNDYVIPNYDEQYNCMKHLAKMGWTYPYFCVRWFHISNKDLKRISQMPQDTLDTYLSRIMCNKHQHWSGDILWAHYSILDEAFDELSFSLDKGHAKQIKSMKKDLTSNNYKYYKNYFNDLFPILEYLYYFYVKGNLSGKRTFSSKTANGEISKFKKLLKKHHTGLLLCILNEYRVIRHLYRSIKGHTYSNMPYGRNSSSHGKFNPDKLKFVDFIKLVLLCRNYSCDICIYSSLINKYK